MKQGQETMEHSSFGKLSNEILSYLFNYLNVRDKKNLRKVCTCFNKVIENLLFSFPLLTWRPKFEKLIHLPIVSIMSSQIHFSRIQQFPTTLQNFIINTPLPKIHPNIVRHEYLLPISLFCLVLKL